MRPDVPVPLRGDDCLMGLTGHELTAASSAVAALAILGGYLGVRAANHNAIRIAREERSARRQEEFDSLRRVTYAKFLAALAELSSASIRHGEIVAAPELRGSLVSALKRQDEALIATRNSFGELEILAPDPLRDLAFQALEDARTCTQGNQSAFAGEVAQLRLAMRHDLRPGETLAPFELTQTPSIIAAPTTNSAGRNSAAALPAGNGAPASDLPGSP